MKRIVKKDTQLTYKIFAFVIMIFIMALIWRNTGPQNNNISTNKITPIITSESTITPQPSVTLTPVATKTPLPTKQIPTQIIVKNPSDRATRAAIFSYDRSSETRKIAMDQLDKSRLSSDGKTYLDSNNKWQITQVYLIRQIAFFLDDNPTILVGIETEMPKN